MVEREDQCDRCKWDGVGVNGGSVRCITLHANYLEDGNSNMEAWSHA